MNALQNDEYSADSKTKAGLIPTEQPAIFHLVQEKVLIFNDEENENFPVDLYNSLNDIFQ